METRDLAHLVDAQLVQVASRELASLPLEQLKSGKEENARKEQRAGNFDIA